MNDGILHQMMGDPSVDLSHAVGSVHEEVKRHVNEYYKDRTGTSVEIDTQYGRRIKQPKRYCVYVLSCAGYDSDGFETDKKFKEDWHFWTDDDPNRDAYNPEKWAWAAFFSDRIYYVGQTNSIYDRLIDHTEDPEKGAFFTSLFPPRTVECLYWYDTREQAKQAEIEKARELRDATGAFVFQA